MPRKITRRNSVIYTKEVDLVDLHSHLRCVADLLDAAYRLSKVVDDIATALGDMDRLSDINSARNQIVFAQARLRACAESIGEKRAAA